MDLTHLVTLAVNGDEQATSEVLVRAARLVYARVFRRIGSGSAAEDVAQDALVALLAGLPRLRKPQTFLPWLRRITDNMVADYFERRGRSLGEVRHTLEEIPSDDDRVDRTLERREERNMVQAALCALPPRSRLAIELFYFHDLTSREVADFLRISDDAAASIGLSPERIEEELRRLQDMRLIVPQEDGWRGTMPVVNESDRELIQIWAQPIVEVVVRRLESLYAEAAALTEGMESEAARNTVMTMWLIEAASRPFDALREQMDVSMPDRGDFGKFNTGLFTFGMPGHSVFSGGLSSSHKSVEDDGVENYLY